jgi:hypothetical protein
MQMSQHSHKASLTPELRNWLCTWLKSSHGHKTHYCIFSKVRYVPEWSRVCLALHCWHSGLAGKYEAEQQHKEAMHAMEERIKEIEQTSAERIQSLEAELDRRATMIDRLSDEMTQVFE